MMTSHMHLRGAHMLGMQNLLGRDIPRLVTYTIFDTKQSVYYSVHTLGGNIKPNSVLSRVYSIPLSGQSRPKSGFAYPISRYNCTICSTVLLKECDTRPLSTP